MDTETNKRLALRVTDAAIRLLSDPEEAKAIKFAEIHLKNIKVARLRIERHSASHTVFIGTKRTPQGSHIVLRGGTTSRQYSRALTEDLWQRLRPALSPEEIEALEKCDSR